MKEVSEDKDEGESSDISGYHSDSESAVMTSGNSPFISKEERYNFLTRSGKNPKPNSLDSDRRLIWRKSKVSGIGHNLSH